MRIYISVISLIVLVSCGSKKTEVKSDDKKTDIVSQPYILLDDDHSIMKNKGKEVPSYFIPNLDSFTVDITGYEFVLPSPEFDYIREGIDYPKMLGGSWANLYILYGDSSEMLIRANEIEPDKKFAVANIKDKFEGEVPDEFKLAFRFYIDNGKGQQEIDHFKVKVIP